MKRIVLGCLMLALSSRGTHAQFERNRDTMLSPALIDATVTELSGARAFNNIVEIAGYEYDRKAEEYLGTYRETQVVERLAKEYGFSNVRVTRLPMETRQWDGEDAELWVTEPGPPRLISRYVDHPAMLAYGSQSGDVTAPLVWVGRGMRPEDYEGKEVKGKVVLTDGSPGPVHDLAVRTYGAAGVVTFVNEFGFGIDRPDALPQVMISSFWSGNDEARDEGTTFGIVLSHRQGTKLLELVNTSDTVTVRVKTKATRYAADHEVVEAWIPGDGSTDEEVVIAAHLFEGVAKQGANDDISGCGAALELGRTWIKLIEQGVLPRPKRAVHFMWVPEIIFAKEYFKRYPEVPKKAVAMTSMDIVGSNQTINRNEMRVLLTPASLPSFLNELYIQFMRWMEDTQTIKFHNLRGNNYAGRYPLYPITDPQGTQDPFHIRIMKHAGGSDHMPFLRANPRVPGVHYMNWPDVHYHTSEDMTKYIDPTQLKRASLITLWVTMVIANASNEDVVMLSGVTAGHAAERIGDDLTRAMELLHATDADGLGRAYKEGLVMIKQAYKREAAAIASNLRLSDGNAETRSSVVQIQKAMLSSEPAHISALQAAYRELASRRGVQAVLTPSLTAAEQEASSLFPRPKGGDPYVDFGTPEQPSMHPGQRQFSLHDEEARNFADGSRSILEIRDAISAELGPVGVEKVIEFFRKLEAHGTWEILKTPVEKPTVQ